MTLFILISVVFLKAMTDGLFYRKLKRASKWVEEIWFIVFIIFAWNHNRQSENEYIHVIMLYIFLRAALFDTLFNLFAKIPILHTGTTSEWDDFMKRLNTWQYIVLKLFLLGISLLVYFKQLA